MSDFKNVITKLRKEQDLNQQEFADKLGVSKSTVSMWEIGERFPSKELYEQIADFFNVDIDYLMTGKEKEFEMYSAENAILLAKVTKNKNAMRMLEYYMKLADSDKEEIEMMVTKEVQVL